MDVRMPDGTIIQNVPDNITQTDLLARYNRFAGVGPKERTWGEAYEDIGASAVSGLGTLVQLPSQLYGLVTGDFSDTGLMKAGREIKETGEKAKSEALKARERERSKKIAEAEKEGLLKEFTTAFGETVTDPALLTSFLAEQAPQLLVPLGSAQATKAAVLARQAQLGLAKESAEEAAKRLATSAAVGAGAVQQGADIAAESYENVYKELIKQGISPAKAAEIALSKARAAGASASLISLIAQRLPGARTLEETFAGVPGVGGRLLGLGKGALGEAASEVAEEAGGKFTENIALRDVAPETDLLKGVGTAAGLAAIGGGTFGGVAGGLRRPGEKPEEIPTPEQPRLEIKTRNYQVIDIATGKPITVQVTEDPNTGEINALGPDGETIDLTPFVTRGKTLEDALKEVYSDEEAPTPTVVQETPPEAELPVPPEVVEPTPKVEVPTEPVAAEPTPPQGVTEPPAVPPQIEAKPPEAPVTEPEAKKPAEEAAPEPPVEPTPPTEVVEPTPVPREIRGDNKQIQRAQSFAKKELGEVVYQDGDMYMYRRYNPQNGAVEYPVRIGNKQVAKDIRYFRGKELDTQTQMKLSDVVRSMEQESRDLEKTRPFMKFDNRGLDMSPDIDPRVRGIIGNWKDMLGLTGNIYIATNDHINQNRDKYVGSEREIIGMIRRPGRGGATKKLANGNRAIFIQKGQKLSLILETLAHEMGHIHQAEVYEKSDAATKKALKDAYAEWVKNTTGKNVAEFIASLRARATTKQTLQYIPGAEKISASALQNQAYWKSFSEWYADQVSRWAVSQEKPVGVVEQFFARLGKAMRAFYQQAKNAGFLPNETFVQYLNKVTKQVDLTPTGVTEGKPEAIMEMAEPEVKKIPKGRSQELAQAAEKVERGEMTAQEYDELVNKTAPIPVFKDVKAPNTKEELAGALNVTQREKIGPKIEENTTVGLRLDINAAKKGVPAITIHESRGKNPYSASVGKVIGYDAVAKIRDVFFAPGKPQVSLEIAKGKEKEPLGTAEGRWVNITPEQAVKEAEAALKSSDWVQVGMDPTRHSYFYDRKTTEPVLFADEVIQIGNQMFAKNVQYGNKEEFLYMETTDDASVGKSAVETIKRLGREAKPELNRMEKIKEIFVDDQGNVKITSEEAKAQVKRFLDRVETWAFSTDAALNNAIRRIVMDTIMSNEQKFGMLLSISSSQAVHADAVASLFIRYGGIKYNKDTYKYEAVDNENKLVGLVKGIDTLASKYKMSKDEAERVAHTAFEAKRVRSLVEFNEDIDNQIRAIKQRIRTAKADGNQDGVELGNKQLRAAVKKKKFIHMDETEIADGLRLFEMMPELNDIVDTWNAMRQNAANELVDSGLWSEDEAEILLSNMDYVPFYREDQIEQGKGPKEYVRRLQVQAKEKRLKGSLLPVNDVFDNMARWTQYAIKRSVMNRLAVAKIDVAMDLGLAKKVAEAGKNTVRVWRDGVAEYYVLDDPMFMDAFAGLEPVAIPTFKFAAKISNMLRQSVVLYPLFSVAQVPQDAFAAMFTSGLKTRFALSIPARAVKEFLLTLARRSQTHNQLERIGAVGIRDFSAAIARNDAEVSAGLKGPPGFVGKAKDFLEHFSMASDNAVRQAVYEATMAQAKSREKAGGKKVSSLDQAQAYEKAFQLINFKSRGSSKFLNLLAQVVPFFNAYLAAQHVALKTLSGVGISPETRGEALKTLGYTTASVMALALMYSMMMDDDDDYINKPSVMRDRLFIIPGTGMSIPIRQDIFSIPKILTEHLYMLMTDKGATDGRKFRDSMKAALGNALLSPTPVPQVVKPIVEVGINYDFFQGRPLVGTYQKGLDVERQFNDSTSELAKLLGQTGMVSPIAADHLIRGMFGSVGGLTLYMTNPLIDSLQGVKRPEMSVRDMIATLPGTSGFVTKSNETGLKNDFYVLRDEVSKAVNTLNDIQKRSPEDIDKFLSDEEKMARVALQKDINKITKDLTSIRQEISRITAAENMSPADKRKEIKELKDLETEFLKSINLKELRRMGKL